MALLAAMFLLDSTPERNARFGAGAALLFATLFILTAEESRFVFDRSQRRLYWRRRSMLRGAKGELPFADIESLALETNYSGERPYCSKRLALVTRTGRIPLLTSYTSILGGQERAAVHIQKVLNGDRSIPLYR
jgi:hypothetical protein